MVSSSIPPPQKAEVSLVDGCVPSMNSQMGVSASGQYVRMGCLSSHFSPVMDLPWIMSSRRATSSGGTFQVWQERGDRFLVVCEGHDFPLHVLLVCTMSVSEKMMIGVVGESGASPV